MYSHYDLMVFHSVQTMKEIGIDLSLIQEVIDLQYSIVNDCTDGPDQADGSTLFTRLGGAQTLQKIAQSYAKSLGEEPRRTPFFGEGDIIKQSKRFERFLTFLTGGSQVWAGLTMVEAHTGREITGEHFDMFLNTLSFIVKDIGIEESTIKEFITLLEKLREDCTNPPGPPTLFQ